MITCGNIIITSLRSPTYLSAVHARCENQLTRKQILSNLIDEEGGTPNHPELWLQFAERIVCFAWSSVKQQVVGMSLRAPLFVKIVSVAKDSFVLVTCVNPAD